MADDRELLMARLDKALLESYEEAKRLKYTASYFFQMLTELGGLETARHLLWKDQPSEGFTRLWELRRLDLTVEAVVLRPEFAALFNDAERKIARQRLMQYDYKLDD
jgi:hypothetical protein